MAYGEKYFAELKSHSGQDWKISIYRNGYTGTTKTELTLYGPDGFVLSYNGEGDEIHEPIKASDLKFNLTGTTAIMTALVADIVNSATNDFIVKLEKWNDNLIPDPGYEFYWGGILTHEITEIPDQYQYVIEVEAIDGISILNDVQKTISEIADLTTLTASYYIKPVELLKIILRQIPWVDIFMPTFSIKWSDNWFPVGVGGTYWQNSIFINLKAFSEYNDRTNEFDLSSYYDILEEILRSFFSEIFLNDGNWTIINKDYRRVTENRTTVFFNGNTVLSTANEGVDREILQAGNNARISGGKFMYKQPVKKVTKKITYETNPGTNYNSSIFIGITQLIIQKSGSGILPTGWLPCGAVSADDISKFKIAYNFGFLADGTIYNASGDFATCWLELSVKITDGTDTYYLTGASNQTGVSWSTNSGDTYEIKSNPAQCFVNNTFVTIEGVFVNELIAELPFTTGIISTEIKLAYGGTFIDFIDVTGDFDHFKTVVENKVFNIIPLTEDNQQTSGEVTFSSVSTNGNDLIYQLPDGLLHDGSNNDGLFFNNNSGALSIIPGTIARTTKWFDKAVGTSALYYLAEMVCRGVHRFTYKPLKLYQGTIINSNIDYNDSVVIDFDSEKLYLCFNGGQYYGKSDRWSGELWAVKIEAQPEIEAPVSTSRPFTGLDIPRSGHSYPYSLGNASKIADHFQISNFIFEYKTQAKNTVLASPAGTTGFPSFRELHDFTYLDFDLTVGTTVTSQEGRMMWDDINKTVSIGMPGGTVNLQLGQEQLIRVKNAGTTSIKNGEVVYLSGRDGLNPKASIAKADLSRTSETVIGVATEEITTFGYVCTFGIVRDLNLAGFADDDIVYLSAGTAGGLTKVAPTAPGYAYKIGIIEYAHATEGRLRVNVQRVYNRFGSDTSYSYFDDAGNWNLKGSGVGITTFKTANAGTSNFDVTFQAKTGTVAFLSDISGTGGGGFTGTRGSVPYVGTSGVLNEDNSNLFWDLTNKRIGFGITTPTHRVTAAGTAATNGMRSWMGFDVYPVPTPASISMAKTAGTGVDVGTHYYLVSYVTDIGETNTKLSTNIVLTTGTQVVTVTIPISDDPRVKKRRLYRTKANTPATADYFLAEIGDNTSTTYVDTAADSTLSLGPQKGYFRPNTTANQLTLSGNRVMQFDTEAIALGIGAAGTSFDNITTGRYVITGYLSGRAITSALYPHLYGYQAGYNLTNGMLPHLFGYQSAYNLTEGGSINAFGYQSLYYNQTGDYNSAFGTESGKGATTKSFSGGSFFGYRSGYVNAGNYNSFFGAYSGYSNAAGSNGIHLGYYAGRYETAGAKLIIDSFNRSNEANQRAQAIIYGVLSGTAGNQILSLGGGGKVGVNTQTPHSYFQVEGSQAGKILAVATNYTARADDWLIEFTTGGFTCYLPTAVDIKGRVYVIHNTGVTAITVTPNGSETIDNAASKTLTAHASVMIISNGANWLEI